MTTTILASFPSPPRGVWHLGIIPIRAYALLILAGVIVALFIGDRRWAQRGGERGVVFDIALWAIIPGLIGGRLYHVLTDWSTYFGPGGAGFVAAFKIQEGGLGIWGAVALGGVGAWIGCWRRGIPLPAFGDAIAPGIVLAQAIGRLGNYFNQELYGRATTLPWGLEIYERRDANGALDSLNGASTGQLIEVVHPTFLYELLWNLLVFALLIWIDRRYRIGHGRLFALYVAAYCFGRFWVELLRSDMATHIAGIRINSFVSVFVFIGAVVYIMVAPKGREDPAELRGEGAVDEQRSPVDEVTKELAAVAATTGVVAAVKTAGEKNDEDAAEAEAVSEAEQLEADVADAPAEDIAEAEAFAEAGEEAEAADVGGVGAVEGDEVVEAESSAPEVHEAALEGAEEAAATADELTDEEVGQSADSEAAAEDSGADEGEQPAEEEAAEPAELGGEEVEQAADSEAAAEGLAADEGGQSAEEVAADGSTEPESGVVGGVGVVEGDEVVEAEESAPEVHEAALEGAEEAAATADELTDEEVGQSADSERAAEDSDADEGEQPAEEEAAEPAELGGEEVEHAADSEVAAEGSDAEDAGQPAEEVAADGSAEPESGVVGGAGVAEGKEAIQGQERGTFARLLSRVPRRRPKP